MKKSLFKKLLIANISIVTSILIFTGIILYGFLGTSIKNATIDRLINTGENISELILSNEFDSILTMQKYLQPYFYSIASNLETTIYIYDDTGAIFMRAGNLARDIPDKKLYKDALGGKVQTYSGRINSSYKGTVLSAAVPILHEGQPTGLVLVVQALPQIYRQRQSVLGLFLLTAVIMLFFSFIAVYILSKKITVPLIELNKAVRKIASGEYFHRVSIKSKDELGQLGATFNSMANSLSQLEILRSSFLADVSHELRTPVTTITGFTSAILDGTISEDKKEQYLSIILDEAKRMSRLISDTLEVSKIKSGTYKLNITAFDINELLRLELVKHENAINDKNINIKAIFDVDPAIVLADKDNITRVAQNLFSNAIKFVDFGGNIVVKTLLKGKKILVSIANSGSYISPDELNHVFERYYKTDKSRSKDKNGVGLGLFLVKNIISAHNENVTVRSKEGGMTEFMFSLEKK